MFLGREDQLSHGKHQVSILPFHVALISFHPTPHTQFTLLHCALQVSLDAGCYRRARHGRPKYLGNHFSFQNGPAQGSSTHFRHIAQIQSPQTMECFVINDVQNNMVAAFFCNVTMTFCNGLVGMSSTPTVNLIIDDLVPNDLLRFIAMGAYFLQNAKPVTCFTSLHQALASFTEDTHMAEVCRFLIKERQRKEQEILTPFYRNQPTLTAEYLYPELCLPLENLPDTDRYHPLFHVLPTSLDGGNDGSTAALTLRRLHLTGRFLPHSCCLPNSTTSIRC